MLPLTNAAKMFEVAFTGCPDCGDGTKYPYAFSIEYDRPTQGPATITRLKALGKSKMAMIQSNDVTGQDYANAISTAAASGGATITTTVKFTPNATDLSAQATQLKGSGAYGRLRGFGRPGRHHQHRQGHERDQLSPDPPRQLGPRPGLGGGGRRYHLGQDLRGGRATAPVICSPT